MLCSILALGRKIIQPVFSLFYGKTFTPRIFPIAVLRLVSSEYGSCMTPPLASPHPHCLYKRTKRERKAPGALQGQYTLLSSNVLSDLAYKLLNFLNFTFPCCSQHLGSQRRKGKSTRPGNSDSDPHSGTPLQLIHFSKAKGAGLGHIPKSSQSGGPCRWEQPEEHHPFT